MALPTLLERVNALTNLNATTTNTAPDGAKLVELVQQFLEEGVKELTNLIPDKELIALDKADFAPDTGETVDSPIISVVRATSATALTNETPGEIFPCRRISSSMAFRAADPDDLEYASDTDPVFYILPQSTSGDNNYKIRVLPKSTATIASVQYVSFPTIAPNTETAIKDFPNELEHVAIQYASIRVLEYLSATEEDLELYKPMLEQLKADYQQSLLIYTTKSIIPPNARQQAQGVR